MSFENFQPASADNNKPQGLNLCDIVGYGQSLKSDLTTYGPGMLESAMKTKPEVVMAAAASAALVTVSIVAGSEVLIGVGGACAVMCALGAASKVATDNLPKMKSESSKSF